MKLQTQIPLFPALNRIDYNSRVVLLGSCFSENIGDKFRYFQFRHTVNPFGVIFNPISLERLIIRSLNNKHFTDADVFEHQGRWVSFEAHSSLANSDRRACLSALNAGVDALGEALLNASHVILTLGTAWAYRHNGSGNIVANCHKVAQTEFQKELLTHNEISESLQNSMDSIRAINPDVQLVLTISPVRHLKDGFVENQRSKAVLISAVHECIQGIPPLEAGLYFPAYELMMDELRDYRFYDRDLVHPNQLAVDYIWERFRQVWISSAIDPILEEVDTVQKGLRHRPFDPDSPSHQKFKKTLNDKIAYLQERFPLMVFNEPT